MSRTTGCGAPAGRRTIASDSVDDCGDAARPRGGAFGGVIGPGPSGQPPAGALTTGIVKHSEPSDCARVRGASVDEPALPPGSLVARREARAPEAEAAWPGPGTRVTVRPRVTPVEINVLVIGAEYETGRAITDAREDESPGGGAFALDLPGGGFAFDVVAGGADSAWAPAAGAGSRPCAGPAPFGIWTATEPW